MCGVLLLLRVDSSRKDRKVCSSIATTFIVRPWKREPCLSELWRKLDRRESSGPSRRARLARMGNACDKVVEDVLSSIQGCRMA